MAGWGCPVARCLHIADGIRRWDEQLFARNQSIYPAKILKLNFHERKENAWEDPGSDELSVVFPGVIARFDCPGVIARFDGPDLQSSQRHYRAIIVGEDVVVSAYTVGAEVPAACGDMGVRLKGPGCVEGTIGNPSRRGCDHTFWRPKTHPLSCNTHHDHWPRWTQCRYRWHTRGVQWNANEARALPEWWLCV